MVTDILASSPADRPAQALESCSHQSPEVGMATGISCPPLDRGLMSQCAFPITDRERLAIALQAIAQELNELSERFISVGWLTMPRHSY
jgi:hypothetical protein